MSDIDLSTVIIVDDEEVGLEQLMGLDLANVEPYLPSQLPAGKFRLKLKGTDRGVQTIDNSRSGKQEVHAVFVFEFEVTNVHELKDKSEDPSNYIGATHRHNKMIFNAERDIGELRAYLRAMGAQDSGASLAQLLDSAPGAEMDCEVYLRADRNDKDKKYSTINWKSAIPVTSSGPMTMAAPAAAPTPTAQVAQPTEAATPQPAAQPARAGLKLHG